MKQRSIIIIIIIIIIVRNKITVDKTIVWRADVVSHVSQVQNRRWRALARMCVGRLLNDFALQLLVQQQSRTMRTNG